MLPKIGEEHKDIVDELFDHATFMVSFILLIHIVYKTFKRKKRPMMKMLRFLFTQNI